MSIERKVITRSQIRGIRVNLPDIKMHTNNTKLNDKKMIRVKNDIVRIRIITVT